MARSRFARLGLHLSIIGGVAALLVALPPGIDGFRRAEGCGGATQKSCAPKDWVSASMKVPPDGVPTDGALQIELAVGWECVTIPWGGVGSGSDGPPVPAMSVRSAVGELVPGTATVSPMPKQLTVGSSEKPAPYVRTVVWRPTSPFAPSTTYALRVEGDVTLDVTFLTGPGPFAPLAPTISGAKIEAVKSLEGPVCCTRTAICIPFTECAPTEVVTSAAADAVVDVSETAPAARSLVATSVEVSVDGGPYSDVGTKARPAPASAKQLCIRGRATNTVTKETAVSDPWCGPTHGVQTSTVVDCEAWKKIVGACTYMGNPAGQLQPADTSQSFHAACGSTGVAGTAGSPPTAGAGASGAGGSEGGAVTAGAGASGAGGSEGGAVTAGAAGTGAPAAASVEPLGGCSLVPRSRPPLSTAFAGLALLAASRRRERAVSACPSRRRT